MACSQADTDRRTPSLMKSSWSSRIPIRFPSVRDQRNEGNEHSQSTLEILRNKSKACLSIPNVFQGTLKYSTVRFIAQPKHFGVRGSSSLGGSGLLTIGWSVSPIADRVSIPVNRLIARTLFNLWSEISPAQSPGCLKNKNHGRARSAPSRLTHA